ncbi:hypothetical protein [Victivallis sp. Marseille-Q1083]|uniref:hypothetical protein n=1 Tax=Victivallis sp. Marseille-Q1083 TaxID=2717288 RepID=UPI00158B9BA4|nr:hypothetical protein [Victivallis sp. Marseille-Q1083]
MLEKNGKKLTRGLTFLKIFGNILITLKRFSINTLKIEQKKGMSWLSGSAWKFSRFMTGAMKR